MKDRILGEVDMFVDVVFSVPIVLALLVVPRKKKAPDPEATRPKALKVLKKVKKEKVVAEDKVSYDHSLHLGKIEKRLEVLQEEIDRLNDSHREVLGYFEEHMVKHHKKEVPPLPPPPKPILTRSLPSSTTKVSKPGPHPEALHPEGPPENMSLGDEHGELGHKTGPEPLKTASPKKEAKKCAKCGSEVGTDMVKCPTCGARR
jgi:hypothetical protein